MSAINQSRRRWLRRPSFPIAAVVVLSLAVAASTAGFSFIDQTILRRITWPDADRLVSVYSVIPSRRSNPAFAGSWNRSPVSWDTWTRLDVSPAFDGVGAYFESRQILTTDAKPEFVNATHTSAKALSLLGVTTRVGRLFVEGEDTDIGSRAVLISESVWHRHFGGRPDVVGQVIVLSPTPQSPSEGFDIVGVFSGTFAPRSAPIDVVLPLGRMSFNGSFGENAFLRLVGRVSRDSSLKVAQDTATAAIAGLGTGGRTAANVVPFMKEMTDSIPSWWLVLASCALLQLIGCVAVAGLFWSEVELLSGQIRLSFALGADRASLVRQTAAEFSALSVFAWGAGIVGAGAALRALSVFAPEGTIGTDPVVLSWRAAAVAFVFCLSTALVAGIAPVWHMARRMERAPTPSVGVAQSLRLQKYISGLAVALALVLVTAALVLGETMLRASAQSLGFQSTNLVVASVRYARYPTARTDTKPMSRADVTHQMLSGWMQTSELMARVRAVPGVVSVAGAGGAPFGDPPRSASIRSTDAGTSLNAQLQTVTDNYFDVVGTRIISGRGFTAQDRMNPSAAVVSADLASRLFPNGAVGMQFHWATATYEVLGVAADTKYDDLVEVPRPVFYVLNQTSASVNRFFARVTDVQLPLASIRSAIETFDPWTVVEDVSTMESRIARTQAPRRLRSFLASVYGVVALALAALALYAITARLASERTREMALRLAIGATPSQVRARLIAEVTRVAVAGLVLGAPLALAMTYLMRSLLVGIAGAALPAVAIGAAAALATAVVAAALPAVRASQIDPAVVLRD